MSGGAGGVAKGKGGKDMAANARPTCAGADRRVQFVVERSTRVSAITRVEALTVAHVHKGGKKGSCE